MASGRILRALLRRRPRARDTAQRLAMLPDAVPAAAPVAIHWDEHQIPFVEAESEADLAAGLGVVHAHLRLGQIEIMRRIALGRVAESVGPLGIEIDRTIRLFGIARAVPEIIAGLPEATRRWSEAFLAGFNHHVAHLARRKNLPHEFAVLRLEPEPWTLTDLFTVARLVSADVNWMVSARLLRARAAMAPEQWRKLWPLLLEGAGADVWAEGAALGPDADAAEQTLAHSTRSGSNCAAVAASRAARGAAMIASDPHLPMTLPPVWLIAGMHAPGINAVGLMLPGLPFIALGRNPWIAWGGTNLHAASSELFDVSGEHLTERWETIRVRGLGARRIRLRESRLGPVVSDGALLRSATPLALRWAGHRPSDELTAMLAVARARDWDQFRAALAGFAVPGQNMLYAGSDGRIGRVLAAHVPRRTGKPADLIATSERAAEWDALATARDHPLISDPPEGVIVSANQEPSGTTIPVGFFFSPAERAARMRALLGANGQIAAADLQRMQMDVVQPGALAMRDLLLGALSRPEAQPSEQAAFDALAAWDGSYAADSRGAAAFELLFGHVAAALGAEERMAPFRAVWTTRHLLARELAGLPAARLRALLAAAFAPAARALARRPDWGALHRLRLRHPFGQAPLLGRRYSFGESPLAGGNETVLKTAVPLSRGRHHVGFGTCARHISDLADPDDNRFVLLGGQDGWLGSANFCDQAALWRSGGYVTVPLRVETARARFPHKTVLRPIGGADRR